MVNEPNDGVADTPACATGCRRHAAGRALVAAAGWLLAAVASLAVAGLPFDVGESLCGIWGCFPPLPALVAMHLFWAVLFAGAVWAMRAYRPGLLRPVGFVLVVAALVASAQLVGRDTLHWFDYVPDEDHGEWPRRVAYRFATLSDAPLLQALAAGVAAVALGRCGCGRCAATRRSR